MQNVSLATGASGGWESAPIPATMRALVKAGPRPGAEIEDVSTPTLGGADVLIRVLACSICGTDLHIYSWDRWAQGRVQTPIVFGHEFCGEVVAVGPDVTRVAPGM